MQSLTIAHATIRPFALKFKRPFSFAGNTVSERVGYYWEVSTEEGLKAHGEIAPLPGISPETLKRAKHELDQINEMIGSWTIPLYKEDLIDSLRCNDLMKECCSSTRFGIESALMTLAAHAQGLSLFEFLDGKNNFVKSAFLLQGNNEQILNEARVAFNVGIKVFKLKVGNRNIPLDVKNVQDLRTLVGDELVLRLDANRVWSITEAVLFADLIGHTNIEYIEEPIGTMDRLSEFYNATHMPVALDETLAVLRCDVTAPGRCMPTLANHDGVKAYCIKPVVLGGVIAALDWIAEARGNGRKAIVSSAFETSVGFPMVQALASLSNEVAGLGTQRFYE